MKQRCLNAEFGKMVRVLVCGEILQKLIDAFGGQLIGNLFTDLATIRREADFLECSLNISDDGRPLAKRTGGHFQPDMVCRGQGLVGLKVKVDCVTLRLARLLPINVIVD